MFNSSITLLPEFSTETQPQPQSSPSAGPKVLGLTMARGGSVGVPRKNLRMVAGKPLLAWTIEESLKCTTLTRYAVSTDDLEIKVLAEAYGVALPFMEPYSDGSNPLIERLQYVVNRLEERGERYDYIVDIRATGPLKLASDIEAALAMLIETQADVVCSVCRLEDHHPSRIKMMMPDKRLVDVWPEPRSGLRQDLTPDVFIRNGSIYAMTRDAVRLGIHFQGGDIRGYEMP